MTATTNDQPARDGLAIYIRSLAPDVTDDKLEALIDDAMFAVDDIVDGSGR